MKNTILSIFLSLVILAIFDGGLSSARSDTKPYDLGEIHKLQLNKLSGRDMQEINFIVRTFLWALDQKQAEVLAKITTPTMRADFPSSKVLLHVMRQAHAPVIAAQQVFLHLPETGNEQAIQSVYLHDKKGKPWKATYQLARFGKLGFRVNGCVVKKLSGKFS